ncbi:hypothetical protein [Bacillus norwichensis]|uniref:DUF4901 domain-containing protein n=1 Tax=Bacillus norwichensis TaxID=2762217 RepID=A0ABR8VQB9_9BACI|nr:hypothetical protein [Bacillus norwichensis]MBD8006961.1 hypothetical protein [Bacillus norwichensis]
MDDRIKEFIRGLREKFGLDSYDLVRYNLGRTVNIFNETLYTLSTEWVPQHIPIPEDDLNPDGTAVIELDLNNGKVKSVIFVGGKSFAKSVLFDHLDTKTIVQWIEKETGLTYQQHFQLQKEGDREFLFRECIDGVDVSPSGMIEVSFDAEGKLTMFTVHGQFPAQQQIRKEIYNLSLEKIDDVIKAQLQLIEFPVDAKKQLVPIYGLEEAYITNDQTKIIPFEFIVNSYATVDKIMSWDTSLDEPFVRKEIQLLEEITIEEASSREPSPEAFPITKEEQEKCITAVDNFLRQEYPQDADKWILKTLHRHKQYVYATLKMEKQDNRIFQRKMTVIIDSKHFYAVNYIDNLPMLEMFNQFQKAETATIEKDVAYDKLKDRFELKPYYVYDTSQEQYILCGKLDCVYGVNALTGEVIALNEL